MQHAVTGYKKQGAAAVCYSVVVVVVVVVKLKGLFFSAGSGVVQDLPYVDSLTRQQQAWSLQPCAMEEVRNVDDVV